MDVSIDIVIDDQVLSPNELLAHEDFRHQLEVLGNGQRPWQSEGGIRFGHVRIEFVRSVGHLGSLGGSPDNDRTYALARFPFSLDQLVGGRRYLRAEVNVELADPDAVAHSTWPTLVTNDREADQARAFTLGPDLTLTSATVLPATASPAPTIRYVDLQPAIVAFGTGMSRFAWSLEPTADYPLTPSTRTVFAVLDLPKDAPSVVGMLSATAETGRPGLGALGRVTSRTRYQPFNITFPPHDTGPAIPASTSGGTGPSVFVSYAYESDEHVRHVVELVNFLARQGMDVIFDQWSDGKRQDWPAWMTDGITRADFIIAVASPAYRRVGESIGPNVTNRGVQAETALLRELQYRDRDKWMPRLLPVVLPGHELDEVPMFLQPYSASNFVLTEISLDGAANLLRVLHGQSTLQRPSVQP